MADLPLRMQGDSQVPVLFGADGTVMKGCRLLEASGILGVASTEEAAWQIGLEWARACVDRHG